MNKAEAADVLNEVMLEVWRCAGRFEGRSKVLTWLPGITHHKAVDKLRRRKNRLHEELNDRIEDTVNPCAADVRPPNNGKPAVARGRLHQRRASCRKRVS